MFESTHPNMSNRRVNLVRIKFRNPRLEFNCAILKSPDSPSQEALLFYMTSNMNVVITLSHSKKFLVPRDIPNLINKGTESSSKHRLHLRFHQDPSNKRFLMFPNTILVHRNINIHREKLSFMDWSRGMSCIFPNISFVRRINQNLMILIHPQTLHRMSKCRRTGRVCNIIRAIYGHRSTSVLCNIRCYAASSIEHMKRYVQISGRERD